MLKQAIKKAIKNEDGIGELTWQVGLGIVAVLIIVLFMVLAPETAENIWDRFINYVLDSFGI